MMEFMKTQSNKTILDLKIYNKYNAIGPIPIPQSLRPITPISIVKIQRNLVPKSPSIIDNYLKVRELWVPLNIRIGCYRQQTRIRKL